MLCGWLGGKKHRLRKEDGSEDKWNKLLEVMVNLTHCGQRVKNEYQNLGCGGG